MKLSKKKVINKVKKFIEEKNLINKGDKILIALSGGSDSVCLFDILIKLREELEFSLCAFHMNHNIRVEALNDEMEVRKLCKEKGIKLYVESLDIPEISRALGLGLEETARIKRYEAIKRIMNENDISSTATAHHLLDNAESVLFNILRGSGIQGLGGIEEKNDFLIRPLLCLNKEEILGYIKASGLTYVTDKTNFDTSYSRNNIRHNVLPHLEEINGNAYEHIYELSNISREMIDLLNVLSERVIIEKTEEGVYVNVPDLKKEHVAVKKQILFNMCKRVGITKDVNSNTVNNVIELIDGDKTSFDVNTVKGCVFKRRYDKLKLVKPKSEKENNFFIPIKDTNDFHYENHRFDIVIKSVKKGDLIKVEYRYVDFDKIKGTLVIRFRKDGDRFSPFGLKGTKKLKKYFIDKKIPKEDRDMIPLLVEGEEIVSVLGYDISEKYKVNEFTKNILIIRMNYK